jgi:hypothetical protein
MFIQVITGKVKDAEAVLASGERWLADVAPVAKGFLGVTSGVTDDNTAVSIVRFESEELANANADLPEQSAWFAEASKNYDGEPTFFNCPEVEVMMGGGSNDAGFVQVMMYKPKDVAAVRELSKQFESMAPMRPDILGATTAFATDGTVIDTNYFTSEAAAREGEKQELPAEMQDLMKNFGSNAGEITFIDLKDPWLR